jgi:hypothetical protein
MWRTGKNVVERLFIDQDMKRRDLMELFPEIFTSESMIGGRFDRNNFKWNEISEVLDALGYQLIIVNKKTWEEF